MLEFNFINHSSFSVIKNNIILTVDPWIEGSVFNNSWKLLSKTPNEMIELAKQSNFVWFSHEHPDHFNPPNLRIFNKNTNFIFQKTKDKRVIKFLKKISPNIKEAEPKKPILLDNNFSIEVFPFQDLDSFCLITADNIKILNLNDCDIKNLNELEEIKKKVGDIDILLAQFSYAIGKTNRNENYIRKNISQKILDGLNQLIRFFKPKYFIPFASFCYFSNSENFYLNDSVNKIDDTLNFLSQNNPSTEFIVFYPGDKWNFNDKIDNSKAISKYMSDYKMISPDKSNNNQIEIEKLIESSLAFIQKTKLNNNLFHFYNLLNFKYHQIFFELNDLNIFFKFDFQNGLKICEKKFENIPICKLSSDSLSQLFNSGYGYDALMIGGRFEANKRGHKALNKIFKFQTKNYQNQFYNFNSILKKGFKKFSKYSRVNPER